LASPASGALFYFAIFFFGFVGESFKGTSSIGGSGFLASSMNGFEMVDYEGDGLLSTGLGVSNGSSYNKSTSSN